MRRPGGEHVLGTLLLALICTLACGRENQGGRRSTPNATSRLDSLGTIDSLLRRADSVFIVSSENAEPIWRRVVLLADSSRNDSAKVRALSGLAAVARRRQEFVDAKHLGEEALALALRAGVRAELSRSYNVLGLIAWDEGRVADALALCTRAGVAAQAIGDSAALGKAEINIGLAKKDLGDEGGARAAYARGVVLSSYANDSVSLGRALNNLAALNIGRGDALAARTTLERARHLMHATHDSLAETNALAQLATAYDRLGEPQLAFAAIDSALTVARRHRFRTEEGDDLKLLGDFYNEAGDYTRALAAYQQAAVVIGDSATSEERGRLLRNQAKTLLSLGRTDESDSLAVQALGLHRAGGFREAELNDLLFLIDLSAARRDRRAADGYVRAARRAAARLPNRTLQVGVILAEGRLAASFGDSRGVFRSLGNARTVLVAGDAMAAVELEALRLGAYAQIGALDSAAAAGRRAVSGIEKIRGRYGSGELRTSYASTSAGVYADLTLVLLRMGRTAEAFEVSDAARAAHCLTGWQPRVVRSRHREEQPANYSKPINCYAWSTRSWRACVRLSRARHENVGRRWWRTHGSWPTV